MEDDLAQRFAEARQRYQNGVYRDRVLHDLILEDASRLKTQRGQEKLVFLDIGCGKGFDTDIPLQQSLVEAAGRYIGIEPDPAVIPGGYLTEVQRCLLEDVTLADESVHVAFAVMVLEHVPDPKPFWDRLHRLLVPGGVFWGMTVDARHWFCSASAWADRLGLKDFYLSWLMGARGSERYENYPTYYRSNTPTRIRKVTREFHSVDFLNLARVGQCDGLFPGVLRPISRRLEANAVQRGKPGTLLLVRAVK